MWEDWWLAVLDAVMVLEAVNVLRDRESAVPRSSSIGIALVYALGTVPTFSMGLFWTMGTLAMGVVVWLLITWWRPVRRRRVEEESKRKWPGE